MADRRSEFDIAHDDLEDLMWEASSAGRWQAARYATTLDARADAISATVHDAGQAEEAAYLVEDARRMAHRLRRGGRRG